LSGANEKYVPNYYARLVMAYNDESNEDYGGVGISLFPYQDDISMACMESSRMILPLYWINLMYQRLLNC
jgi:hypothetical protein